MTTLSLAARSASLDGGDFNWVFLIWYLVAAILTILFLFYFNRVFANLVTCGIRAYLWHYYRVDVHVQALQVSLLAGRVFFKNVRYHGQNQTILIHDGYVTWRYWLRRVQELETSRSQASQQSGAKDDQPSEEGGGPHGSGKGTRTSKQKKSRHLPCRVLLKARGVQWFVYNRSPAYDAIFRSMTEKEPFEHVDTDSGLDTTEKIGTANDGKSHSHRRTQGAEKCDSEKSTFPSSDRSSEEFDIASQSLPGFLNVLPMGVECGKGAMVVGNRYTGSILTAKFESATGKIHVGESRPIDEYEQIFDFDFVHPIIELKPNKDYTGQQISEGARLHSHSGPSRDYRQQPRYAYLSYFHNLVDWCTTIFRGIAPHRRGSLESLHHSHTKSIGTQKRTEANAHEYGQGRWLGLTRYLDDNDGLLEHERWKAVEYGQFTTICDSPNISMSFHWDVPGIVREKADRRNLSITGMNINGDDPPGYGIDLKIGGGIIHYGPWADRQRSDLQTVFFPALYRNSKAAPRLTAGQRRVSTVLEIVLEIEESTTLRIPTREESKDSRWRGHQASSTATGVKNRKTKQHLKAGKIKQTTQSAEVRPHGWLDVKVLPNSTVRHSMSLQAGDNGYLNRLDLDLKGLEISSSVNHGLLLRSKSQAISCDLSNPLTWGTLRQWHINIHDNETELFILRDHIFLLTDLISDWTSGPPGSFHTFVPFEYTLGLHLREFKLYLNANDSNIINSPSDLEDNAFIIVCGEELKASIAIPAITFRPARNRVTFDADVSSGNLLLHTPPWNTQHTFLANRDLGSLKELHIKGTYDYFTSTSPSLTDTLLMDVDGILPSITLYGFLIRYLMVIKDNYFGDNIHFRTLEEYQAYVNRSIEQDSEHLDSLHHDRISNDLDVILGIAVENLCVSLPAQLYSSDESVQLEILSVAADLRITNYYMDCMVLSSPIALSHASHTDQYHDADSHSRTQVFVDGFQVFGHRLFGLPPTEPTYVCNWDFDIGSVTGECSIDFARQLTMSLKCFGWTFADAENALPPFRAAAIHDVTFLRLRMRSLSLGVCMEHAGLVLGVGNVDVQFDDWAGELFSDRLSLLVENLTFAIVDVQSASTGQDNNRGRITTHAYLQTALKLHRVNRKRGLKVNRQLQQGHISLHDGRTHRVPWLIHQRDMNYVSEMTAHVGKSKPPAMPYPSMPEPIFVVNPTALDDESSTSSSIKSDFSKLSSTCKSSFLVDVSSKPIDLNTNDVRNDYLSYEEKKARHAQATSVEYHQAPKTSMPYVRTRVSAGGSTVHRNSERRDCSLRNYARSNLSFSSPYKKPYFVLLAAKLDTENLPCLPEHPTPEQLVEDDDGLETLKRYISGRETPQSSFMLDVNRGISAFWNPEALTLIIEMLTAFQTDSVINLLDDLQINAMTDVLDAKETKEAGINPTDLRICIPYVAMRFVDVTKSGATTSNPSNQCNINISHFIATASFSSKLPPTSAETPQSQVSMHVIMNQIDCSMRQKLDENGDNQAIIRLSVMNPIFWMRYDTTATAEIQFEKLEVANTSQKVDYAASLIDKYLLLYEDLAVRSAKIKKSKRSRIRLLVHMLAKEGSTKPDPLFLTRVSYVLRSASRHIRSSDSWRQISHLRHTHQSLPLQPRNAIDAQCTKDIGTCPQDAGQRVASNFRYRQVLEPSQAEHSLLMQRVYGESLEHSNPASEDLMSFRGTMRAGVIRILVKPGRKQNEVAIKGLVIGVALNQCPPSNVKPPKKTVYAVEDVVQVHCVEIALRLNWTLLELFESIAESLLRTTSSRSSQEGAAPESQFSLGNRCRHVVVSSEMAILNCDTPTLKVVSLCHDLQTSIMTLEDDHSHASSLSVAMNADIATTEIKNHSATLTHYKLGRPKVFGSRHSPSSKNGLVALKLDGTGEEVLFQVFANPLQLIEAVDAFLEQEVAHIRNWTRSSQFAQAIVPKSERKSKQTNLPIIQISLSLNSYIIRIGILPSLIYQISGTQGHSSIKLGTSGDNSFSFGFSLEDHLHTFETKGLDTQDRKMLSTLQLPPVSGRIALDLSPGKRSVILCGFIENIFFDASAVHAILSAINRPEIVSFGRSISHEVSVLQGHYEDIFDAAAKQSSVPTLYDANVILSSIVVHSRTFDASSQGAELRFSLSRVRLKATHRTAGAGAVPAFPELDVYSSSINLGLSRFDSNKSIPCGDIAIEASLRSTSRADPSENPLRSHQIRSTRFHMNVYDKTAPTIVAILAHLQDTLRSIDLSHEVQELKKLKRKRLKSSETPAQAARAKVPNEAAPATNFDSMYFLDMTDIRAIWKIEDLSPKASSRETEDLMLSITKIELATKKDNAARLLIENLQLQLVPSSITSIARTLNSALLPQVLFNVAYVSTAQDRRLAFKVVGKSLDLQLTSNFILPANHLRRSIALSIQQVRTATDDWTSSAPRIDGRARHLTGNKRLASLLVDADFAGAVVYIQGQSIGDSHSTALNVLRSGRVSQHGRYNQFAPENARNSTTTLRAPGIAFKVEYKNAGSEGQSLQAETKVDASSNILYPTIVPLIMDISSTVKDIVGEPDKQSQSSTSNLPQPKFLEDQRLRGADPSTIFGDCRLNLGLRICRQEFSLSCQPIARVTATARFEDIYVTVNTVQSQDHGKFFTISGTCSRLQSSIQHVYSRESTGSFEVESIVVSLMNSKHVTSANGISAIINISPMKAQVNGKQSQDFLLFREIWMPPEIRRTNEAAAPAPAPESQAFIVQRYQQIAAAGAFPWNATISIAQLDVQLDLGQSLGKSVFEISNFWISSKKTSDWEQNLCLGFDRMAMNSTGRMSGYVDFEDLRVRTSIRWPVIGQAHNQIPLVQASLAFDLLRVKASFDYQAFAVADIAAFEFTMYNIRDLQNTRRDRLVGVLDGDKVQVFCTTTSAAQSIALYQAFQRLYQEKLAAYQASLRDIEKFLRRKSSINTSTVRMAVKQEEGTNADDIRSSLKLQTDVLVTLKAIRIGAFPNTFSDNQIFKLEALDASVRFAVVLQDETIHSTLGMTLGQLRIALSNITRMNAPKTLDQVSIADVVIAATGSRGGTILKVPKLVATMETWQRPDSMNIHYVFKSSFQGRVDVGWNYSRISYIRGMWASHTRALAQRLGKPLPQSAVQITGGLRPQGEDGNPSLGGDEEGKITAVVNVPQSKYSYTALQPPIIETPQLRDMGEATPPLEWIGLHRERLPNLTHQIVIVTLLEVAKEVDDAYSKILGSS